MLIERRRMCHMYDRRCWWKNVQNEFTHQMRTWSWLEKSGNNLETSNPSKSLIFGSSLLDLDLLILKTWLDSWVNLGLNFAYLFLKPLNPTPKSWPDLKSCLYLRTLNLLILKLSNPEDLTGVTWLDAWILWPFQTLEK